MSSNLILAVICALGWLAFLLLLVFPSAKYTNIIRVRNRHRREIEQVKANNATADNQVGKSLLYVDSKGNRWYEFTNILNMCNRRNLRLMESNRYMPMNITKPRLQEAIDKCLQYLVSNKTKEAVTVLVELEARLKLIAEREVFIDSIAICYLFNDEKTEGLDDGLHEDKKKLISEDDALFNFFLRDYLIKLRGLEERYVQDFQSYFKKKALEKTVNILNRF